MDKSWMDKQRGTREYFEGVKRFVEFASLNARNGKIPCPCVKCVHSQLHPAEVVRGHLNNFGILSNYRTWTMHGESQSTTAPVEVRSSHVHENLNEYGNFGGMLHNLFSMHDMAPESMDEGPSVQQPAEDPSVQQPAEGPNDDAKKFYKMIEDVEKPLYKGCTKFSIFSAVVVLYQLKSLCGWSNKSFTLLLQVVQDLLPLDATLPKDCYGAKKIIKDLGLGYEKIHACINDCMLFWKQDANLEACKFCGVSRWKEQNTTSREPNNASSSKGKKKASKMLRWFPLKPRLQRLFLSPDLAGYMKWHATGRTDDEIMRHPADSEAWKMFDTKYIDFSSESRNVRLGLASDGFNPYGILSTSHSTWPVVLVPYNLPPWMCMKRSSLILSLVVPGPSSPGIAIDVYLQPLIEELRELWDVGVEAYDASSKNRFQLRAALMWTINDFPAYSDLSGWSTKGMFACPSCASDTDSRYLKHGHKVCYMGHRRWLDKDHPYRKEDTNFDGTQDMRLAPVPPSGLDILMDTESLDGRCLGKKAQATFKKRKRGEENVGAWNKRSILFTLPYWRDHKLRHNLDVMHIEKNVTDNIIGTLLGLKGKTKDNPEARLDLQAMGIRSALHLKSSVGGKYTMPHACFNMTAREKDGFLQVLKDVRVPDGYASNISRRVNLKDRTISGLKSHDNHILMQQLLPIALRKSLPASVTRPLMKLSCFFREICSKTLEVSEIENLEKDIAVTLCELEKIFPPSFFTVMVHLVIHLAAEAKMCGPVHYRWMYPIERYLSRLKSYVRNRAAPEGSIAEGYYVEECLTFCARYMEGVETIFNRPTRLIEGSTGPVSSMQLMNIELTQAHRYILFSSKEITKFIELHRKLVEEELQNAHRRISEDVINKHHMEQFCSWLRRHVVTMTDADRARLSDTIITLSRWPYETVKRMKHYVINGLKFRCVDDEAHRKTQNCGVSVVTEGGVTYYGVLTDIIELNYSDRIRHVLFKCRWVDVHSIRGYKVDEFGFPMVNLTRLIHRGDKMTDEPFVLASEASQVFYVADKREKDWYVVVKTKARDVFDAGTGPQRDDDDDAYTYCEHVPYNIRTNDSFDGENDNQGWARDDIEGMTIDAPVSGDLAVSGWDDIDENDVFDDEEDYEDTDDP
ncbi:hypothetical protein SO802_008911 [Lithocarpus litseifolius]|uniref:Transposase n=1 Tax=Lithocarpus litseifolius TaxID=425828 RepID=A0AAW2DB02_9ROSI